MVRTADRWTVTAGLHLQVGALFIQGIAAVPDITAFRSSGLAVIPGAQVTLQAPLSEHVSLRAGIDVDLVAVGLEARSGGLPSGGLAGTSVGASAGITFE